LVGRVDKAQWIPVPARIPTQGLAIAACLLAVACGPTVEGRPITTGPTTTIGMTSVDPTVGSSNSVFDCEQVEVPSELGFQPPYEGAPGWYWRPFDVEQVGDEVLPDQFTVYISSDDEGSFDLGEGNNGSWAKCTHCLRIDLDDGSKTYFQESGTIEVDDGSQPMKGRLESDLVDVRLVEVEIDLETGATERVDEGDCIEIADTEIISLVVEDWLCPTAFYGSGDGCDCGCGVRDPDCPNKNVGACEFCGDTGSCAGFGSECPDDIQADDNAVCDIALAWKCDMSFYGENGQCDCGCGLPDPDCDGDQRVSACDTCDAPGSCAEDYGAMCLAHIHGTNNGDCAPFEGWTCDPNYYGSADGCDCGCGVRDPDCSGDDACVYCNNVGSCAETESDCDTIDPADTGTCN
jgi:hypothetical protein